MDLLFKRYASPFLLLDNLILISNTSDFIDELVGFVREENLWEFFLHKVYGQSWEDFYTQNTQPTTKNEIDLGATVIKSKNILNNFTPE